jgi:hypothetical protein
MHRWLSVRTARHFANAAALLSLAADIAAEPDCTAAIELAPISLSC